MNLSFRLFLGGFPPASAPSFSSSSLLSIISGLLVRVAMELAVFRRGEMAGGGEEEERSLEGFLESQEKALVSFREGGAAAGAGAAAAAGWGGGEAAGGLDEVEVESTDVLLVVAGGDHGMEGKAWVMLLREMVLEAVLAEEEPELFSAGLARVMSM